MLRNPVQPIRSRKRGIDPLIDALSDRLVGQQDAIDTIAPYVKLFHAGIAPEGRPVGVFLLLGPTGTGKTRTVEALAEVLHGSERNVLRIDCGEFQMEHEVAKLIGAPPGYLGHRETTPMLNQQKLNAVASDRCPLSLVLFDEVEKAAASLARLLLGVLDKATLKLGDNTQVNFERSLIFLTSNLGAREMMQHLSEGFGFSQMRQEQAPDDARKLDAIAMRCVRRQFSPEFVNRIDHTITYRPLQRADLERILDIQLRDLREHLSNRLGARGFEFDLTAAARAFVLEQGASVESGARELKRVIHRHIVQAMASFLIEEKVTPGAYVRFDYRRGEPTLRASCGWPRRRKDAA